jgi:DNA-directed RNA polymerase subunit RPC12/RpoP
MSIFSKSHVCPNCGSQQYYKSRRKGLWEHVLHTVFFISPYRCAQCDERYFRSRHPEHTIENRRHHAA